MTHTVLFGNGLNRAVKGSISWAELLDGLGCTNGSQSESLPNTMAYEKILLDQSKGGAVSGVDELQIKKSIANALQRQETNDLYRILIDLKFNNYLTTNYDHAFQKAMPSSPVIFATEDIYSLRRKRTYISNGRKVDLWNIHGEIDHPKSIMLGLDHYCGSISKLDAYIKGTYTSKKEGKSEQIKAMATKIQTNSFCHTSWVDLFFSGDVHIIGLSLDFSETDLWWVLNRRARLKQNISIENKIYFHAVFNGSSQKDSKLELLKTFGVDIVSHAIKDGDYFKMYKEALLQIAEIASKSQRSSRREHQDQLTAFAPG